MTALKILVVDDDVEIARALEMLLKREGYDVIKAHDGIRALEIVESEPIHLILLDVMMPKLDGLSATLRIREGKNIPIIILSAKTEDSDKVLGLSMGADDYVTKPYNPQELLARVKSQLRRYMELGTHHDGGRDGVIRNGGLILDRQTMQFSVDGDSVKLTGKEFGIMELLMSHPGVVFSSEKIYERVWQESAYSVENTVMVHIRRIREKIEINPKEPNYLKVVWGIGYKIEKF
ncbi:MAG: response regulator transcription factor [Clostridiales bacterium]|nr:response regulator transcription factor [Clostridiales bacterium]